MKTAGQPKPCAVPDVMRVLLLALFAVVCACQTKLFAATYYVNLANSPPLSPYINWTTAATNTQDAVDASVNGNSASGSGSLLSQSRDLHGTVRALPAAGCQITLPTRNKEMQKVL